MSWAAVIVGVVGTVASTTVSVMSASAAADSASNTAKYNEQVELNNAAASAQQAKYDAEQIAEKGRRQVGLQRAAMSASGFDVNTGTFNDVLYDTKKQTEKERLSRIYLGRMGVVKSLNQANLDSMSASNAQTAGQWSMLGSGIGAIGQLGQNIAPAFQKSN